MTSKHYVNDRKKREQIINLIGQGNIIKSVEIDKGHKNGTEIHQISDTGIVIIFNKKTKKLITKLIARPNQIKRYFSNNEQIPEKTIVFAYGNMKAGFCYA